MDGILALNCIPSEHVDQNKLRWAAGEMQKYAVNSSFQNNTVNAHHIEWGRLGASETDIRSISFADSRTIEIVVKARKEIESATDYMYLSYIYRAMNGKRDIRDRTEIEFRNFKNIDVDIVKAAARLVRTKYADADFLSAFRRLRFDGIWIFLIEPSYHRFNDNFSECSRGGGIVGGIGFGLYSWLEWNTGFVGTAGMVLVGAAGGAIAGPIAGPILLYITDVAWCLLFYIGAGIRSIADAIKFYRTHRKEDSI
jgi:hypothetical protein